MNNVLNVICPHCFKESIVEVGGVNQYYESIVKCQNEECGEEFAL